MQELLKVHSLWSTLQGKTPLLRPRRFLLHQIKDAMSRKKNQDNASKIINKNERTLR